MRTSTFGLRPLALRVDDKFMLESISLGELVVHLGPIRQEHAGHLAVALDGWKDLFERLGLQNILPGLDWTDCIVCCLLHWYYIHQHFGHLLARWALHQAPQGNMEVAPCTFEELQACSVSFQDTAEFEGTHAGIPLQGFFLQEKLVQVAGRSAAAHSDTSTEFLHVRLRHVHELLHKSNDLR